MSTALVPDSILRDLTKMWTSLAKPSDSASFQSRDRLPVPGEGASGSGVLRACSLTLVVFAGPDDDAQSLGEILAALMPRHPARAIVIRLASAEPPGANVTAQCWMPFGHRRQICSEQIEVTVAENSLAEIVSLLSAIAAPDLPLVAWCRGSRILDVWPSIQLPTLATRVIVDTARWPDPQLAIRGLREMARTLHVGDLSWTRLTRWRELLAQVFENPKYGARVPQITGARVMFRGTVVPVEAWYMAAWLRLCLGGIEVEVARDPANASSQLQGIELRADGFTVTLTRLRETLVATADGVSRCINLPVASDYLLMNEELDIVHADPLFERTLAATAESLGT